MSSKPVYDDAHPSDPNRTVDGYFAKGNQLAKGHGPPKGTRNNLRHGLTSCKLPPGCRYIEIRLNKFRARVEDEILARHNEVSLVHAAAVQTAIRHERIAMLAQKWLCDQYKKLSVHDRLNFAERIAKASDQRDKALRQLGIDKSTTATLLDSYYSTPRITDVEHRREND